MYEPMQSFIKIIFSLIISELISEQDVKSINIMSYTKIGLLFPQMKLCK